MISYKLVKNTNEASPYFEKFYAKAVHTETTDLNAMADRIQRNCSLKKSDVLGVLTELVEVLKDELQASHVVRINGLGMFKVGLRSTYADSEAEFNAATNVTGYRVNFRPEYNIVKTGQYVDEEGVTRVKRAAVADLTKDIKLKQY